MCKVVNGFNISTREVVKGVCLHFHTAWKLTTVPPIKNVLLHHFAKILSALTVKARITSLRICLILLHFHKTIDWYCMYREWLGLNRNYKLKRCVCVCVGCVCTVCVRTCVWLGEGIQNRLDGAYLRNCFENLDREVDFGLSWQPVCYGRLQCN